jgi:23S rRNA pseudouridine1911/1915/1917 synthase
MNLLFNIEENDDNKSIKEFLKKNNFSNRLLLKLRKNNGIFCNNFVSEISNVLHTGDTLRISLDMEEDNSNIVPANIPLDIVYEDEGYLVINKKPNIAVHPSILHYDNSLSNGVKYYFDKIRIKEKNTTSK